MFQKRFFFIVFSTLLLLNTVLVSFAGGDDVVVDASNLNVGWKLQSSAKLSLSAKALSSMSLDMSDWYSVSLPTTVLGALVSKGVYPDPYFGMNMRSLPGGNDYGIGDNFSNSSMSSNNPFNRPWIFRKEFDFDTSPDQKVFLNFDGINYRANIWLNGTQITNSDDTQGTFRSFRFDVSQSIKNKNILVVEVSPPQKNDLGTTWVDWSPFPPDKNLGLLKPISLFVSGALNIETDQVKSFVDPASDKAQLLIRTVVTNSSTQSTTGLLKAAFNGTEISQSVALGPRQTKTFYFFPKDYQELTLSHPELWWPRKMGEQPLHQMIVSVISADGQISDSQKIRFGIRQVDSEITSNGARIFRVNGKPIMVRGGGWSNDLLMRVDLDRMRKEFDYITDLNLNTIRLEGQVMPQEFFDLADEKGILVIAGFPCCNQWQNWGDWRPHHYEVARESLRSQLRALQNHPSVLAFLYGSDHPPILPAERNYLKIISEEWWDNPLLTLGNNPNHRVSGNPTLPSASSRDGVKTGLKMSGPYQYVPPSYWFVDKNHGGGFGFNTETSVGPAPPPLESIKKFIPQEFLWPTNQVWSYHAGGGVFENMSIFDKGLALRYGLPRGLEEYLLKSQVMAYDGHRAMFEAYEKNKYHSATGVVQWMLNNGWPSLIWHLYDYFLQPGGAYFGAKKANEDIHPLYALDDRGIYVVNNLYKAVRGYTLRASVFDFNLKSLFSKETQVDLAEDSTQFMFNLPAGFHAITKTYFVKLDLLGMDKELVSTNFYWLSTKKEVMDWGRSDFSGTPVKEDADLTLLNQLPSATLSARSQTLNSQDGDFLDVTVENTGSSLAFFVTLQALDASGNEILPVLWSDNDISLLPGEKRGLRLKGVSPEAVSSIKISGWNVRPFELRP